jgi:hypothetical protein
MRSAANLRRFLGVAFEPKIPRESCLFAADVAGTRDNAAAAGVSQPIEGDHGGEGPFGDGGWQADRRGAARVTGRWSLHCESV